MDEVLYRVHVRGLGTDDCADLVAALGGVVQSGEATALVLGNRLSIVPNCNVEIPSIDSQLSCSKATEPLKVQGGANVGAISGSILAAVLVVLIIVAMVVLVMTLKKKTG